MDGFTEKRYQNDVTSFIKNKRENRSVSKYRYLNVGEKIRKGDEYNTNLGIWRIVPEFLIGDIILESSTQWRRYTQQKTINKPKKKWYLFLFSK